jgi:hypothetical protein
MSRLWYQVAFGWLAFGATMHFSIDVLKQHFISPREFNETTRNFYGMHTSFAASQMLFALLGFLLLQQAPAVLRHPGYVALTYIAGAVWLAVTFLFMTYWEPKLIATLFLGLFTVATLTGR